MDKPTVLLIDLSSLFWTQAHVNGDSYSTIRIRVRESIDRACGMFPGALVAICTDEGRSFRKDLLPEYKSQRPDKDQAVLAELARCKDALRASGHLLWGAEGFEADDVLATAALQASDAGHPFVVASADKDLLQLLALPDSKALRTHTWTTVEAKDVEAKFGVTPYWLGDWLALTGDTSDNIKGCPGVGEKRATDLLQRHGNLAELYKKIHALHVGTGNGGAPYIETMTPAAKEIATPAIINALWVNEAQVLLARKLVQLRIDAPIKFEEIYQQRTAKEADVSDDDVDNLISGPTPKEGATVTPLPTATQPAPEMEAEPIAAGPQTTALVPASGVTYERALEPTSTSSAVMLATKMFNSRLYSRFGTAEGCLAVILRGRALGIGAGAALDCFHPIETPQGTRLGLHAHLIVALAEERPECDYFMLIESNNERATYETKHRKHPKPVRHTYTIKDAVDAGLCGMEIVPRTAGPKEKDQRGNWDKRRAEMLRKTAAVQLVRIVYPAAALGLYAPEEFDSHEVAA